MKRFIISVLQPEYKYWTCQKYNGLFWGGYLNGAQFNYIR